MSMIPWVVMAGASALTHVTNPIAHPGEPGYTDAPTEHFRVLFENDSAFNRDRNYTHGSRLDYVHDFKGTPHAFGLSLTQNIYTPEKHTRHSVKNQHPYAGYLALGGAYLYRGEQVGCSTEFQLGTTGKPSLAKDAQYMIHSAGNMEQWDGWGDQIRAELTIQLSSRQDYRLPWLETQTAGGWQTDGLFFTRENAGTFSMLAGAGFSFRVGRNLPDNMRVNGNQAANFGAGLIRSGRYNPAESSWFLVLQGELDYVARDLTIDGGVFHKFRGTCSRTPWQFEGQAGLGVSKDGIDYFAGALFRTRGYRTQDKNTLMGTFSITWNW